jgi:hypothetical protein
MEQNKKDFVLTEQEKDYFAWSVSNTWRYGPETEERLETVIAITENKDLLRLLPKCINFGLWYDLCAGVRQFGIKHNIGKILYHYEYKGIMYEEFCNTVIMMRRIE